MMPPTAILVMATAVCGAIGTALADRRSDAAGFGGMSIAGRGLLWASGGGFVVALVFMSNPELGDEALMRALGWSAVLLVGGLVLYAFGQRSDGSAAWHARLEAEAPELDPDEVQRRVDRLP